MLIRGSPIIPHGGQSNAGRGCPESPGPARSQAWRKTGVIGRRNGIRRPAPWDPLSGRDQRILVVIHDDPLVKDLTWVDQARIGVWIYLLLGPLMPRTVLRSLFSAWIVAFTILLLFAATGRNSSRA